MGAYLVLRLDDMRVGLPLACVERMERAVQVTRLPAAPAIVLGVIDVRGRIVPVIDMRSRFRLPRRPIGLDDRIVVARTRKRPVALVADAVGDVAECDESRRTEAGDIAPGLDFVKGVVRLDDGLILIHDLDGFLSLDEEAALAGALEAAAATP